ncbi:MAG: YceD family protein [Bacteroidales bacterium]
MSKQDLTYQIQHSSLEKGSHEFEFQVDERLFARFDSEELLNPDIHVDVVLHKENDRLMLHMEAEGTAELQCDRCLDYFTHPVKAEQSIMVKFDEETNYDLNEDFVIIDKDSNAIDIAYLIYEMIILSLPVKRVHPPDENGNSTCNPEVTKYIAGESKLGPDEEGGSDMTPGDDSWKDDLKDLIN